MAQLAIKGHATRGKEVIEILKMLGGKTHTTLCGNLILRGYYIGLDGFIDYKYHSVFSKSILYSLEEFLEKFPYRVGDKVKVCGDNLGVIIGMRWECGYVVYKVKLSKNEYETSKISENLQPYEEAPMYLNRKVNGQAEEIKEILEPVKEIIEERKYSELRMPLDDDDKLAIEATIEGNKITPPENYLIGKVTKIDNGMFVEFVKKQPQYPKTYVECCNIIGAKSDRHYYYNKRDKYEDYPHEVELLDSLDYLRQLLICRNAYWKIAGEQMGLGKPWEPDFLNPTKEIRHFIFCTGISIEKGQGLFPTNKILIFPTEEMCDAFYENFKNTIELCKELL